MKNNSEFQKYNFFRSLSWRWDRVLQLIDRQPTPGRCTRRDDHWVRQARQFMLRWRALEDEQELEELWLEEPGLFYAYQFYQKANEEPEGAAFIEARILARQSFEQISSSLKTHPSAIAWYEALFFNVLDAIDSRDWITARVLVPAVMRSYGTNKTVSDNTAALPFRDSFSVRPFLDGTLKLFAYFGGPHVVDTLISGFQSGKPVASPEDVASWFDHHWAMTIRRRSHQASLQFEVNRFNVMELFAAHTRIIELERSEENKEQQRTTTERHIRAMIDEIPWMVGRQPERTAAQDPLTELDRLPAELRDDELLRAAAGEDNYPKEDWPAALPEARTQEQKVTDL